jgi:hypothetical protein
MARKRVRLFALITKSTFEKIEYPSEKITAFRNFFSERRGLKRYKTTAFIENYW